ncbi:MAG: hypothetical protein EPN88_04180 [Bacteroidetes bacterium]|nr:MAG: hypothetical protein EPN88_04180 [Bacteroidota bacterium]
MIHLKKALTLSFFLISFYVINAQRLNTGVNFDFYGINITRFPSAIVFSETSYKAYYLKLLQAPAGLQYNYGFTIIADYSRFFINSRFSLYSPFTGIIYKLSYPIAGNKFLDYYSRIQFQQAEISGSFGYFLNTRSFLKPYLETGLGRTFPYFYVEDLSDDKKFKTLWSGRQELRKYLNLDKPYTYFILGFGYRGDMFSFYSRYKVRLGHNDVYFSNLSFGMAVYTKFSKLRKHYIFQPEE